MSVSDSGNKRPSKTSANDKGERGNTGDLGVAGERGPKGDHGQDGQKGPRGPIGEPAPYLDRKKTLSLFVFVVLAFVILAYRSENSNNEIRDGVERQDNFISEVCTYKAPLAPKTCGLAENK